MNRFLVSTVSATLLASMSQLAAAERVVTVHFASPAATAPLIDGKLDDACWAVAPHTTTMYNFWSADPAPADSHSEFQLAYDSAGVYLGVRCQEEQMDKIKASITQRGHGDLWTDDCLELYLDPTATAVGFRKFVINTLGTQSGTLQMDGANVDHTWNPDGWQVAVAKDAKGWTAELFFPSQDLGRQAQAGSLWRFAMCRFGYATGRLNAATSSPGAKFANPSAMGWLYFLKDTTFDPPSIGAELGRKISGDWLLPLGSNALAQRSGKIAVVRLTQPVVDGVARVGRQLAESRALPGAADGANAKELSDIAKLAEAIPQTMTDAAEFSKAMLDITALESRIEDFSFSLQRDALLHQMALTTKP